MYRVTLTYQCGHSEPAEFAYPMAARDWQRAARTEPCTACAAKEREAAIAAMPAPKPKGLTPHARKLARQIAGG